MNRKSNPWVAMVALILLLVLIVCTCVGCDDTAAAEETDATRFIVEQASVETPSIYHDIYIITDTETGVQYIVFKATNCAGMTKLEPAPENGR